MSCPGDGLSHVLALLYAGPGSALCRTEGGILMVRPAGAWDDEGESVVLTQDQLLDGGVNTLLGLVA